MEALGSGAGIKKGLGGKKQLEAPRDMKGLKALGTGAAASAGSKGRKQLETPGRRRSSVASRAVREELPPLSGSAGKSKSGKQAEGLAALAGLEVGAGASKASKSEKGHRSETSSVGRRHSVSSTHRATASVVSPHHTERPRRSKSVKQPSEYGSEAHSIAQSRKSHKQAIEYGSEPLSISPSRAPPEYKQRRGVNGYAEAEESRSLVPYDSRRSRAESEAGGELYVIEVEEDLPRRRKITKERSIGVVEISHSKGRTVYMVK